MGSFFYLTDQKKAGRGSFSAFEGGLLSGVSTEAPLDFEKYRGGCAFPVLLKVSGGFFPNRATPQSGHTSDRHESGRSMTRALAARIWRSDITRQAHDFMRSV